MAALQVNNLPFDPSIVFQGNISIESGKKAADYFLSLDQRPDSVFAVEDFCALGLMKSIKEHGLKIPEEFALWDLPMNYLENIQRHLFPRLISKPF